MENFTPAPLPSPQAPPTIDANMIFRALWALLNSALVRLLLGSVVGGATAGYTVSHQVGQMIPELPKGILPKILPKQRAAEEAIGKITFGNSGCTASIIGPVQDGDTTIDVLTAAHCVRVGQTGVMILKDGRRLPVRCISRCEAADAAWLRAEHPGGEIPYLLLAESRPEIGAAVWHQGYGIHLPGNRESGTFLGYTSNGMQCRFRLSVSSGDSGGGILLAADNRVLSPVCCTTKRGATGEVFGATPEQCAACRPPRLAAESSGPPVFPFLELTDEEAKSSIW